MRNQRDCVRYGSTRIAYEISRSDRRRTVAITVRPDQSVRVAAPKGLRRTRIAPVVLRKAEWIVKCWEQNNRAYRTTKKSYVSGESLKYLGRQYPVKICRGDAERGRASVGLLRGRFVVTVAADLDADERHKASRAALISWYREHATQQIVPITEGLAPKLGVSYATLEIRDFAKRWGSTGGGVVRINWRIVMAPRKLVEYVVAHELCHLRHHDHSTAFWRMLASFMPDHVERCEKLARLGPQLTL
jgi:predicted metal-dependent hydrolase